MACSLVHLIVHMVNKSDNNLPIGIKNVLHCMGDQINLFSAYIFSLLQRFKNKPGSIEMSMKTFRSYKAVNLIIRYIKNFVRDFRFTNPFYTIQVCPDLHLDQKQLSNSISAFLDFRFGSTESQYRVSWVLHFCLKNIPDNKCRIRENWVWKSVLFQV